MTLEQRQYPIGKWAPKKSYSTKEIERNISIIEKYPAKYKRLAKKLSDEELAKQYREGAWNVRQLLTHISDMHIMHYARFKQALTDENPTGFIANINAWNATSEISSTPAADALLLLEATHKRWVFLMRSMSESDFDKTFYHALRQLNLTLGQALSMAAWHTRHHFEHIKIALND
ncbi:metal-dependent hydrolase [Emticicia oligotrophica DSM 17448]|uniref:Metal-dependent hydrolase n=1 Tax=Emticicia oligotrophica (strain DSM 17448 / CIP 109782 / MTCC 6937 / GPTSA100-15) TaxID=929562 RepID=A0ABN4AMV9_EMTOG|nr:putative metal-dependent hydrolase [Emticicia oligotrophica]AFK03649.1 metal-dependent hydrolase [Emticicia oligotrophica DSM 17448]